MTKVRDLKHSRLGSAKKNGKKQEVVPAVPARPPIKVTLENAPLLQVHFLEAIALNLRAVVVEYKKLNLMVADITKEIRKDV